MTQNTTRIPTDQTDLAQLVSELDDIVVVSVGAPLSGRAKAASSCCCSSSCCCFSVSVA
jgi:hypothetical protein